MQNKKQVLNRIKKYSKAEFNEQEYLKKQYINEEGKAVIIIKIENVEDIYSVYSVKDKEILSKYVSSYIEDCAYNIPVIVPIKLVFDLKDKSKLEEAEKIKRVCRENFGMINSDKEMDIKLNYYKMIRLATVGILTLLASYIFSKFLENSIIYELISVAGTFAIWEAVNCFVIEKRALNVEKINAGQLAIAEIEVI